MLVSIVLALGITHLIAGLSSILRSEGKVRLCWLQLTWSLIVLVVQVSVWWRYWDLSAQESWGLFQFMSLLLVPILLFLAARVIMPDVIRDDTYDLRAHFEQVRKEFFWTMFIMLATSLVIRPVFFDEPFLTVERAPAALIVLLLPVGAFVSDRRIHGVLVGTVALIWSAAVAFVWGDLRQG